MYLKKNSRITGFREWLKTVFETRNKSFVYFIIFAGLVLYFGMHIAISGRMEMALPFYMFFLSLPGNLFIGGLEEAGWAYIMQPGLARKLGYIPSCILSGGIWLLWHIPLFFIPGTNHAEGVIHFWMFAVQCMGLRFFFGAICKISGKSHVFMCVLFHTMFNAASSVFASVTTTWSGTIAANALIVLISIATVSIYEKKTVKS